MGFSPEALDALTGYDWPGNIRQLANTIERAAILEESDIIQGENTILPEPLFPKAGGKTRTMAPPYSIRRQEKEMILEALERSLWVQKDAANLLGLTPRSLNYKIKKFGISHHRWRKHQ